MRLTVSRNFSAIPDCADLPGLCMLGPMGFGRRLSITAGLLLAMTGACGLAQMTVKHPRTRKTAQPTTVEVINGTQERTQVFAVGEKGGKVVGNGTDIRVLNGTTWSTASFAPQPRHRSAKSARGVTEVNVLNGTRMKTQTFKGGVPRASRGTTAKPGQPVVIGIESVEGKRAVSGADRSSGRVVVGVQSSDTVRIAQPPPATAHRRRPPYHPPTPAAKRPPAKTP